MGFEEFLSIYPKYIEESMIMWDPGLSGTGGKNT